MLHLARSAFSSASTACRVFPMLAVVVGCATGAVQEPPLAPSSPLPSVHQSAAAGLGAPLPGPSASSSSPPDERRVAQEDPEPAPSAPPPRYPFHDPVEPSLSGSTARRHANLSPGQCKSELVKRKLPVRFMGSTKGVATPVRLTGPLEGVKFAAPGSRSVYGILDCRLVLALAELARVLTEHDVVRVNVDNFYRPRARLPRRRRHKSQHAYGLAIDVMGFETSDGRKLVVEDHWSGDLGEPSCGPDATLNEPSPEAIQLRTLLCAVARAGVFHHILTPSYDRAHADHFHLDVKRDAKALVVR